MIEQRSDNEWIEDMVKAYIEEANRIRRELESNYG